MIYSRWGQECRIVRVAVIGDVKKYDNRKPDKHDRNRIKDGCYLIIETAGRETLAEIAFLRADEGSLEITKAIRRKLEEKEL